MESVRTRRATLTGARKEKEKEIPLVPEPVQAMTDSELVKALAVLGIAAGPITSSSRTLYERIYVRKLTEKAEEDAKTETSSVNEDGERKQPKRRSTRKSASNTSTSDSHQTTATSTLSPAELGNAPVAPTAAAAAAPEASGSQDGPSSASNGVDNSKPAVEPETASADLNAASAAADAAVATQAQDLNPTPEPAADLADLAATSARTDSGEQLDPLFSDDEEASSYERAQRKERTQTTVEPAGTFHWVPLLVLCMALLIGYALYTEVADSQ